MSFNAQIRADIETLDVTINNYERMENAPQAWERIKKILVVEKFTSTNISRDAIANAITEGIRNNEFSGEITNRVLKVISQQHPCCKRWWK